MLYYLGLWVGFLRCFRMMTHAFDSSQNSIAVIGVKNDSSVLLKTFRSDGASKDRLLFKFNNTVVNIISQKLTQSDKLELLVTVLDTDQDNDVNNNPSHKQKFMNYLVSYSSQDENPGMILPADKPFPSTSTPMVLAHPGTIEPIILYSDSDNTFIKSLKTNTITKIEADFTLNGLHFSTATAFNHDLVSYVVIHSKDDNNNILNIYNFNDRFQFKIVKTLKLPKTIGPVTFASITSPTQMDILFVSDDGNGVYSLNLLKNMSDDGIKSIDSSQRKSFIKSKLKTSNEIALEFSEIESKIISDENFQPLLNYEIQNKFQIPAGIFVTDSTGDGTNGVYICNNKLNKSPKVYRYSSSLNGFVEEKPPILLEMENAQAITLIEDKKNGVYSFLVQTATDVGLPSTDVNFIPINVSSDNSRISLLATSSEYEYFIPGANFFVIYEDSRKALLRSQNMQSSYPSLRMHKEVAGLGHTNLIINNIRLKLPGETKGNNFITPDATGFPNTYLHFNYIKDKILFKLYFLGANYYSVLFGALIVTSIFMMILMLLSFLESRRRKAANKIAKSLLDAL